MRFEKQWEGCGPPVRAKPSNGRQIASMSAWRVICRLGPDESVHRGQRVEVTCFGSRTGVYRLQDAELTAVASQRTKAGLTIIGHVADT
jgi:hypothetical protein